MFDHLLFSKSLKMTQSEGILFEMEISGVTFSA